MHLSICSFRVNILSTLAGIFLISGGVSQTWGAYSQGFNGNIAIPSDWTLSNLSTDGVGGKGWDAGYIAEEDGTVLVPAYEGDTYALASYLSTNGSVANCTISNWLISPQFTIQNGDTFSFYTTTQPGSQYPDRLQFRLSSAGASLNVGATADSVGDFTALELDINPTLTPGGYPESWTLESFTVSGLSAPTTGRVAFRYFVADGGINGANSNIIGVDNFITSATVVPEPSDFVLTGLGGLTLLSVARSRRRSACV